jgi:uncharacterized protein (TIGR03083 family)
VSEIFNVRQIAPLARDEARRLALEEYARFAALLASLGDAEWETATECPGWTVRQMARHVVGSAECDSTSKLLRETIRGRREQRRMGLSDLVDGINQVQIRDREGLTPSDVAPDSASLGRVQRGTAIARGCFARCRSTCRRLAR